MAGWSAWARWCWPRRRWPLAGAYRIQGVNPDAYLLGPLVVLGLLPGITEEIIARGILFRVVEEGLGTWVALVISALLFGFGHMANPNATVWSSVAIAIEAGLLLGMAYAWTRSLWFCMGLHAAWNFTQGPLLGIPVSGFEVKGLLVSTTQGPALLSGGEFGAEASILTVIVCVSLGRCSSPARPLPKARSSRPGDGRCLRQPPPDGDRTGWWLLRFCRATWPSPARFGPPMTECTTTGARRSGTR